MSPAIADPLVFTLRAGPECYKWGDPYRTTATLAIQWDRKAYISAVVGPGVSGDSQLKKLAVEDARAIIRCVQALADVYGYTELFEKRFVTNQKTGEIREHIWRVPMKLKEEDVVLDAGIPNAAFRQETD